MNLNKPIRIEYTGKPFHTKCSMCAKCAFLSPSLCVCMNVCLDVQIYTKLLIKIHGCIIQPVAKPTDKEREREIKYHSIVHVLKMENLTHCSTNTHTHTDANGKTPTAIIAAAATTKNRNLFPFDNRYLFFGKYLTVSKKVV